MNIEEILKKSNLPIEDKEIKFNEPMNKHSTFKIGGPAECFIKINKEEQLKEILLMYILIVMKNVCHGEEDKLLYKF